MPVRDRLTPLAEQQSEQGRTAVEGHVEQWMAGMTRLHRDFLPDEKPGEFGLVGKTA